MTIGAVLDALKPEFPDISISKIRFLEAEGLVTPERTPSGYRHFSEDDVERLRYILTAQRDRFWPLKVIRDYPGRVAHVHCKDVRGATFDKVVQDRASFLDGVLAGMFTVPGDGGLDYAQVMTELKRIGYSGWIVIEAEQDPALADPRTYAELGLRTLRNEASKAGLQ